MLSLHNIVSFFPPPWVPLRGQELTIFSKGQGQAAVNVDALGFHGMAFTHRTRSASLHTATTAHRSTT